MGLWAASVITLVNDLPFLGLDFLRQKLQFFSHAKSLKYILYNIGMTKLGTIYQILSTWILH